MRSYKLIKKYPGSDTVGTTVTGKGREGWYTKGPGYRTYDWALIVLNPEYWEEVVEKDYEIVARKIGSGAIVSYEKGIAVGRSDGLKPEGTMDLAFALNNLSTGTSIHSVKRLSDGEVFTVGDCFDAGMGSRTIESIWVDSSGVLGFNHENGRISNNKGTGVFYKAKKISPVLFTTKDGVGIRKGDTYYFVDLDGGSVVMQSAHTESGQYSERKYFSTYKNAEGYLFRNKPCLSIRDIERAVWLSARELESLIKSVKEKAC